jgi:hypothetical protein
MTESLGIVLKRGPDDSCGVMDSLRVAALSGTMVSLMIGLTMDMQIFA